MAHTETAVLQRTGIMLAAATVLSLPLGAIYAFSVFIAPLEAVLNASRTDLASVFGISVIAFTVGLNLAPRLFGLVPVAVIVALSMALSAVGVAIAAVAPGFLWLAFGYGVLFALGGGLAYVAAQQSVNATPIRRPGLVNGYLVSLFPLGAMLAAPAFGWGIARFGVRETLAGLAVTVAVCGAVATVLILQAGVRLSRPSKALVTDQAQGEAARLASVFWRLFLVFTFAAAAGLMVLSQVVVMLEAYGAGKALALAAATGITAAIAAGRLTGGLLVDRLSVPVVAASAQAVALVGAVMLVLVPRPETAIAGLAMIGIGYGLISGVTAGAVALFWPKALFGQTVSRIYIAWCIAALTLPVAGAKVFELTGGYHWAVVLAGISNFCGVIVGATLPRQGERV
jgi:OFA family oxalate/formate antiporter-like MFS transporter